VNAGYNVMQNFSEPVGLRDNFNGPQVGISSVGYSERLLTAITVLVRVFS
jgi:hypothetical protein